MFTSGVAASVKICRGDGDIGSQVETRTVARPVTGRTRRRGRRPGGRTVPPVGARRAIGVDDVVDAANGPAPQEGSNT